MPRFPSGARDVLAARDAVYDLLSAAFLLRPEVLFYLVSLSNRRAQGFVTKELAAAQAILDVLAPDGPLNRPSTLIESTASLVSAKAALLDLNAALSSQNIGIRAFTAPAILRFRSSVEDFAQDELAKNVVVGGEVTATSEEVRAGITTNWDTARGLRSTVDAEVASLQGAVSNFDSVRLPSKSLAKIVSKMNTRLDELIDTLSAGDAESLSESREALLILLSMRTLLSKLSTFRAPQRVIAGPYDVLYTPDSAGTPAGVDGSVSAPFVYAPGANSLLLVDSNPYLLTLPGTSMANLRGVDSSAFPMTFTGAEIGLLYGATGSVSVALPDGTYPTLNSLVVAVDAAITTTDITVGADGGVFNLVHFALGGSYLELLVDTPARAQFTTAVLGGTPRIATEVPVSADDLRRYLAETGYPAAFRDIGGGILGRFAGYLDGQEAVSALVQGTGIVAGATTWESTTDLETLGVLPGHILTTTAGSLSYVILGVSGGVLTTQGTMPSAGPYDFEIGEDLRPLWTSARSDAVHVIGASPRLDGIYRAQPPVVGQKFNALRTERAVAGPVDASFVVEDLRVRLETLGTVPTTTMELSGGSDVWVALGLGPVGPTYRPAPTDFLAPTSAGQSVDVTALGAAPLDVAVFLRDGLLEEDSPTRTVSAVSPVGFSVTPGVEYPSSGNWRVRFERAGFRAYDELLAAITAAGAPPAEAELDAAVNRLRLGAAPTAATEDLFEDYVTYLTALLAALRGFTASRDPNIDAVVRTLEEQGMDRALDLLLHLDFSKFFALGPDEVSYSTTFVRKAAEASKQILPTTSGAKSAFGSARISGVLQKIQGYDPWGTSG